MGINRFSFEDKSRNWKLEMTDFQQLTLLVGASGVGKTQILKAIDRLRGMAKGVNYGGIHWYVDFTTIEKNNYIWEGEFEMQPTPPNWEDDAIENIIESKILYESIHFNGQSLAHRKDEKIVFDGKPTIKLSKTKSLIYLLMEEEPINKFHEALNKINTNYNVNQRLIPLFDAKKFATEYDTIDKIRDTQLRTMFKLFLAYDHNMPVFLKIQERFCDIFPQIEKIMIEFVENNSNQAGKLHLFIKEKGIKEWINTFNISSGMWQSLMLISELYLASEGSVFLIDEFENSLGINCLDELVNDILRSKRNLQFILTSHHPYIINNINFNHWKVVTRNGGVVKTHNAAHFHLGKSKHTAFMQLIQLEAYQTGSETSL
jgi:predicted ATPase